MASTVLDTTPQQQQTSWVPYEPSKDCSQGFCSIYCPQWCYIIFPPPPPVDFSDSSSSSSPTFSPLVIAIIGILASAFLLITYYTIISKYCGSFDSLRRRRRASSGSGVDNEHELHQNSTGWQGVGSEGLDEAVIKSITVCKYRKEDGFVDGTDCSVCLTEFEEDERLRLLPKCSHAFHVSCIDTWLKSHSNCPLCRANVVLPPSLIKDDCSMEEDLETATGTGTTPARVLVDGDGDDIGVSRRSISLMTNPRPNNIPVLISDVLEMDSPVGSGAGSSSQSPQQVEKECGGTRGKNSTIAQADQIKRSSSSSGRFQFQKHGKGNTSILPV